MADRIEKVAIVGMGALGLLYGSSIVDHADPKSLTYVMDEDRVKKYSGKPFTVNGKEYHFQVTSDPETADLCMIAVKYPFLDAAIEEAKKCIGQDTVIISVMNGIVTEDILAQSFEKKNIVHTIALGMDAMHFGNSLQFSQMGALRIGIVEEENRPALQRLVEYFTRIEMPFVEEDDIMYKMWEKLMINVGINQTCMVYDTTYSQTLSKGEANRSYVAALREVLAVANAEGIALTEDTVKFCIEIEQTLDPDSIPSMAQDRKNKKPSEVELFAGTVIRLAKKHGISVPTNEYFYERVHEIEREYLS